MKLISLSRLFDNRSRRATSAKKQRRKARDFPGYRKDARLMLETLEDRTLMSVLPPSTVSGQVLVSDIPGGGTVPVNQSSPSVVIDPVNPQKLFSVFTVNAPDPNNPQKVFVYGASSTNGGQNWSDIFFPGNDIDPTTLPNNPLPFAQGEHANVSFGRNEIVYVVYSEHNVGNTTGEIVLQKFDFTGSTPQLITPFPGQMLAEWIPGQDQIYNPIIAVDNNLASYTDPQTHAVQTDVHAGNVYVAWNTNNTLPGFKQLQPGFNPFTIKIMVSSDGANTFSGGTFLNAGANYPANGDPNADPQLVISQGTADGRIPGGQVTVVWNNYVPGSTIPPPGVKGFIETANLPQGGSAAQFDGVGGFINDASQGMATTSTFSAMPQAPINDPPSVTTSSILVGTPNIDTITKVTVSLDIDHKRDGDIRITLIAPDGTSVILSNQNGGNSGAGYVGTTFDDAAGLPISQGVPPYTGSFRPDTPLANLSGLNPNGTWQLQVTDLVSNGLTGILHDWTLNITGTHGVQGETNFTQSVNITTPGFTTVSDLDLSLILQHPSLSQLKIELISPLGTSITLVDNRLDSAGATRGMPPFGLAGTTMGIFNGVFIGTTFDEEAARPITDSTAAGFVGHFRTEGHFRGITPGLDFFNGLDKSDLNINGQWTLRITDFVNGPANPQPFPFLFSWSLKFSSGLPVQPPINHFLAETTVQGSFNNQFANFRPLVSPDVGVGPSAVIASDNTLGSFSPNQGRLYVAYVSIPSPFLTGPEEFVNTYVPDDYNIYLMFSDDGGGHWSQPHIVNDDTKVLGGQVFPQDGFSEGTRPQFQPAIAVDQTTGSLVLSWLDARNDAARSRVATYMTTSIDGGLSFSKDVYVNQSEKATDAITGKVVNLEPLPDNESAGNPTRDPTFAFGDHQGLAVANGRVYPVWSANLNASQPWNDLVAVSPTRNLDIFTALVTIATGPRVIDATMGPVKTLTVDGATFNNTFTQDGIQQVTGFTVVFDRPVDPLTFDQNEVTVIYRNTTTPANMPGTPVAVSGVTPLDNGPFGATTFLVTLATPQSGTGTYSYAVGPNIRDKIRTLSFGLVPGGTTTYSSGNVNLPVPPDQQLGDTGGPNSPPTQSTIGISGVPNNMVVDHLTVTLNINHTFDSDLVISLMAPDGTVILLSQNEGANGQNYTGTTFDDAAPISIKQGTAPFNLTYRPEQPLAALIGKNLNGTWTLLVKDTAPGDVGTLLNWSLNIQTGIFQQGADNLGNFMDQNANAVTQENPGDLFATPQPINGIPFVVPYNPDTLPIIVPGPHVTSTSVPNNPPAPDNLVLNKTNNSIDVQFDRDMQGATFTAQQVLRIFGPAGLVAGPYTVTANPNGTDPDPNFPRTFRIGFPTQALSGTYTVVFGPNIRAKNGDLLDTNLNAGLDNLRGVNSTNSTTASETVNSNASVTLFPGKTVNSTINVTDSFVIQSLTLGLTINHPFDPDLTASLIAPDGTIIRLFTKVGASGTQLGFQNTVFDDRAQTPIQLGLAPFTGSFNPQTPLSVLQGKGSTGIYTLQIKNDSDHNTGMLVKWSLTFQKSIPGTGLGEPVADQATATFRIFTLNATNPLAHDVWTAVGPASNNSGGNSGRIGGIAVDPSDPSGNTVYIGGASGGVWKTTNFLTTDARGPTYTPLTDFGPTFGINIGGIAVFGRNNNPNQSVIFAATGEGDTGSAGVGFLRSLDGGATWDVLDSTTNVDSTGVILPISSPLRDHALVGNTSFQIIADPTPSPSGDVIVYAAMSGTHGGLWRSLDSGKHWQNVRPGQATDVTFAQDSASAPTNNLQVLFGGFRGEGVFISPNQGFTWNILAGGVGDPLIRDADFMTPPAVPVVAPTSTPNGAKGRIVLATAALTGNPLLDKLYEGFLYVAVATTTNTLDGLYMTKDFGQNWAKVRLPVIIPAGGLGFPSNNETLPDYNVLGSQGNYDISLVVDPTNPNIVYLGGSFDFQPFPVGGLIRVDTTQISDAHALVATDNDNADGGLNRVPVEIGTGAPTQIKGFIPSDTYGVLQQVGNVQIPPLSSTPYLNLIRDPNNPFLGNATILVTNVKQINNSGAEISWMGFNDIVQNSTDQHRVVAIKDPITGHARLIFGDDQGVYTGIDLGDGTLHADIGTSQVVTGSRSGNLQITQFYYGAAQPSNLASQIAGALFYGNAQDDGQPQSDPNVLTNGNIGWTGPVGDGTGVATDQTGSGTAYHYNWPCCGGDVTNFFKVTLPGASPVGRTFGLLQAPNDPQWPFVGGFNFAVNPVSGNEIVISSGAGRVFRTQDQGVTWFSIGEPTNLDSTNAQAPAFGAADPNGVGNLDNYIFAGTVGGHIFVTFSGGGNGSGNGWIPLSNGLDGSAVQAIVTDPVPGSHDAFAVTQRGVYRMFDSRVPGATWVNITGNVFSVTHNSFFNGNLTEPQLKNLTSIVADYRYKIPDNPGNPNGPTHPVLYVAGEGGVYRSKDAGKTWTLFPDVADDGAPVDGGFLPNAHITDLSLVLGNVNPTTGLPDQSTGPDLLLATTYGRGSFAIRLPLNLAPGPRVVSFAPLNVTSSISSVTVTFNGSIDPSTFTLADISTFLGPTGPITATAVTDVDPTGHRIFQISFPTQTAPGTYTLTFGPAITDFSGNQMDQNQNGINGEGLPDSFTGHFSIHLNIAPPELVFGADAGGGPEVRLLNAKTNAVAFDFYAYASVFKGGVRVALGDVNNDGFPDIITAPGPGGGPAINVYDGLTGAFIRGFYAYDPSFKGGVYVASADVNGDGYADIITGAGPGGGPNVKVFSGKDGSLLMSFYAYSPSFTGGVQVATGDINGDGYADIITAAGPGGGPHVEVFSGKTGLLLQSYYAFDPAFRGGVNLGVADLNGDGRSDIITGMGAGGSPTVKVFSGTDSTVLQNFLAYSAGFTGGVRVAGLGDINADGHDEILTGAGPSGGPHAEVFDGITLSVLDSFFAYNPAFTGGIFVGGK